MIVLVGGEKGGTGKTTLATALAAMRASQGQRVVMLDADPQRSATYWCAARSERNHASTVVAFEELGDNMDAVATDLAEQYDDVLIDSGGRDSVEMRSAMLCADLMLVPVRASQFDIWTLAGLDELVETALNHNPNLVVRIVINNAPTHAKSRDLQEAAEAISEFRNLRPSNAVIYDRVAHRRAIPLGLCACDLRSEVISHHMMRSDVKATNELIQLYEETFNAHFKYPA